MRKRHVALPLAILCIFPLALAAQGAKRPMSPTDAIAIKTVSDTQISPDGTQVAFVLRELDLAANEFFSNVWIVPVAGGEARRFTSSLRTDSSPRWSPDGKWLAFLSSRESKRRSEGEGAPKTQIWVLHVGGGEAHPVTDVKGGVSGSFAWSPDGARIAFTALEPQTDEEQKRLKEKRDMVVVGADIKMSQLWVVNVATKDTRQLTSDRADVSSPAWSPDGQSIAFVQRPTPKPDDGSLSDVYVIAAAGGAPRLLVKNPGPDASPVWSPDGRSISPETARSLVGRTT
jgi:Tol biopolymer transport system component